MSAIQKEQIYVELREYHLDEFPESLTNSDMNDLLSEYRDLEDKAIAMLLGLVNGKTEFVDLTTDFKKFIAKTQPTKEDDAKAAADRKHFADKAAHLGHILEMGAKASFTIRPPRKVRISTKEVETKITKS